MVRLTVIIVNYNGGSMIESCLRSLYTSMTPDQCEVIVVDNASDDGSDVRVARNFPAVRVVRNNRNEGFARAVNQGIAVSHGAYILLLNNDTEVERDAIPAMLEFMDRMPACGLTGPQLYSSNGRRQHSFDVVPTLVTEVMNKSLLKRMFPGSFPSKRQERTEPYAVETLLGAALMIRREVLEDVGVLDERFFFCLEETDLCVRARQAGWKIMMVPSSRVLHLQGATRARAPVRGKIEYLKSMFQFFLKHYGWFPYVMVRVWSAIKSVVNCMAQAIPMALTLGLLRRCRDRWILSAGVCGWHMLLCPGWWGISDGRKRYRWILRRDRLWCVDQDLPGSEAESYIDRFDRMVESGIVIKDLRIKRTREWAGNGRSLLIKQYKRRGILDGVKVPKALKEAIRARRIVNRGVPVVAPLAAVWDGRDSYLISRKLEDWDSLDQVLMRKAAGTAVRRRLLRQYGRFARQVHDAGVFQYDFDPNNVMVRGTEGTIEFRLVDFEKTRVHARIGSMRRLKSLAKTNRIGPVVSRTDRMRFLKGYLCRPLDGFTGWKGVVRQIVEFGRRQWIRDCRRLASNCMAENRNFGRWVLLDSYGFYRKQRPEVGREGLHLDEIEGILKARETKEGWDSILCENIADEWRQANVRAKEGGAVPVLAVARIGERSGTLYYYKLLDRSHRSA